MRTWEDRREALVPWLLLLPAALLALPAPFELLSDDPFPHLAGVGWSLVGFLPLAIFLALWGFRLGHASILLGGLFLFSFVTCFGELGDALEARRALGQLFGLTIAFVGATRLTQDGRRRLEFGVMWLSLAWCGTALVHRIGAPDQHLAGVLGDTGSLSQAALPGAVIGAWYAATRRGKASLLGLVSALVFILHAGWAPVLTGGLVFVITVIFSSMSSPWPRKHSRTRRILGGMAAIGIAALILFRGSPSANTGAVVLAQDQAQSQTESEPAIAVEASKSLGGIAVRGYIWKDALSMWSDAALFGVGPGQFQARFPPYRSANEIEQSRHGVCNEDNTEVEHAHSDPLEGLAEYGLLGGVLWLWLLFKVAGASLAAIRSGQVHSTALGAAGLALLLNALLHAPLLANPAAGPLAFAIFGTLVGPLETPRVTPNKRMRGMLAIIGFFALWQATVLIRHGRDMANYIDATRALEAAVKQDGTENIVAERRASANAAVAALEHALEVAPRSAEARLLAARIEKNAELRYEKWLEVLEVRPFSVEAHEALGISQAREGNIQVAREHLQRAIDLSPKHPRILKNLIRLEMQAPHLPGVESGLERGKLWLARLREIPCDNEAWIAGLGANLVLQQARFVSGSWLLESAPLDTLGPEQLHAAYKDEASEATPHVRDALECIAQLLWARQHANNATFRLALRNYRQAQRKSALWIEGGAPALRLERAAAEALEGNVDTARELIDDDATRVALQGSLDELPDWAQATLLGMR